ncbi:hypothetical protein ACSSS7_000020 [Eimeria intestinalis]
MDSPFACAGPWRPLLKSPKFDQQLQQRVQLQTAGAGSATAAVASAAGAHQHQQRRAIKYGGRSRGRQLSPGIPARCPSIAAFDTQKNIHLFGERAGPHSKQGEVRTVLSEKNGVERWPGRDKAARMQQQQQQQQQQQHKASDAIISSSTLSHACMRRARCVACINGALEGYAAACRECMQVCHCMHAAAFLLHEKKEGWGASQPLTSRAMSAALYAKKKEAPKSKDPNPRSQPAASKRPQVAAARHSSNSSRHTSSSSSSSRSSSSEEV